MIYAVIENGKVSNLAVGEKPIKDNWIAVNDIPVCIGDGYADGAFYRDGEKVITEEERLRNENAALSEYAEAAKILLGEVDG